MKTDQGERKYAIYVPEGYDGSKVFPVILFLHGAGERGEDGIQPAQAGIGPAIFNRPHGVPAMVVFPQARRTWAAGSDDINAAIKALDDVMPTYAADPQRVILTGLSMGGRGSWELAAAHPERFAAVVPICGPGKTEQSRQAQVAAGLVVLRRRRPRPDRPQHAGHGRGNRCTKGPSPGSPSTAASAT